MSDFIINLLLFFFQFEYLSKGESAFTVSRVVIFPLLCMYLILQRQIKFPITKPMFVCLLFLIVQIFSSIGNAEYPFLFSALLQFLILFVSTDYLCKKRGLDLINWWILCTYDITSIICYFIGYSLSETSRFSGIYWDPNVMCFYVLVSISAKLYLFPYLKNRILKVFLLVIMIMDIFLIIQSLSRGALLGLILVLLIVLYKYSKALLAGVVASLIPLISYLYVTYKDTRWDSSMSSFDLIMFRLFSTTGEELTSAQDGTRLARYQTFFDSLWRGDISIIGNATSIMSDGEYVHNGLLELILAVGPLMGVLFIIMFLLLVYKTLLVPIFYGIYDFSVLLPISFLFSSFFYSYLGYKMFWLFIAILIFRYYDMNKCSSKKYDNLWRQLKLQ